MRSRVLLGVLVLLAALAFVVPANAITINGVDYTLLAQCKIGMENGPTVINGNVGVNEICGQQNGFLQVGAGNTITGSGTANRMSFGTGASVGTCNFNVNAGGNPTLVCGAQNAATLPITTWPPLPVPAVTPGATDFNCAANTSCTISGAVRDITIGDNATVTLTGDVQARSALVSTGATLNGNGHALNLTANFVTEPGANIDSITVTTIKAGTVEAVQIGNGSTVTNTVLYAPFARMHLHQGGSFTNFEGIAVLITVEPIQTGGGPNPACACIGAVAHGAANGSVDLSFGCHLNAQGNQFFVATSCAIDVATACPGPTCFAATLQPGATDATGTITSAATGTFHVIVENTGGAFCSADTVTLP